MSNQFAERGLPSNLEAERLVLGSIMIDAEFEIVAGSLNAADFSLEKHRRIWQRMADLNSRGAALYLNSCSACHGPNGEGKSGPKLAGTSLTADQIAAVLTKGAEGKKAPHGKPVAGLTADQATAVAAYVKTLQ